MSVPTLFVFAHFPHARSAGFNANGAHRSDPDLFAVWPGTYERARGKEFGRVIVTEYASLHAYKSHNLKAFWHEMDLVRLGLRLMPMTWIGL